MSIAIVSDVHGNRQAFEAVLRAADDAGCVEVWSLGDLVGYGADPEACVALARDRAHVSLAGNHDLAVIGALDVEDFSSSARLAALWTRSHISDATRAYLGSLAPLNLDGSVGLYHASPRDPVWEYVLSPSQAAACLDAQAARVGFIGHSHVALSFSRLGGAGTVGSSRGDGETLDLARGEWLINPGSVGQPRDGDPRAAWLEVDLGAFRATFHRVEYDRAGAQAAIREAGLPASLADRLAYGQ